VAAKRLNSGMKIFVTGATGFVGSAVVQELIGAGHQVVGLARSDASAALLEAAGADVHRGTLDDLDSLKRGAEASDGVIHAGYNHDWLRAAPSDFVAAIAAAAETDRRAIETLGEALAGSGRPLVVTSGTALVAPGRMATEETAAPSDPSFPRVSEPVALTMAARQVRVSVVRLPPSVHGAGDHGFVPGLIGIARGKGVSGYVEAGSNRWPAVHRLDAARVYRLALEKAPAGSRLHAVADEGVALCDIAAVIGRQLNLPVISVRSDQAAQHFGALTRFVALDCPASSALTQQLLEWRPAQPGLIEDLEQAHYFASVPAAAR